MRKQVSAKNDSLARTNRPKTVEQPHRAAAASASWSTQRRDLFESGLNRRLWADLESLLEPLLDVLALPAHDRGGVRADAPQSPNAQRDFEQEPSQQRGEDRLRFLEQDRRSRIADLDGFGKADGTQRRAAPADAQQRSPFLAAERQPLGTHPPQRNH